MLLRVLGVSKLAITSRLIFWIRVIFYIIVLLIVFIAYNIRDILLIGAILTFLDFFLGLLSLGFSLAIALGDVGLGVFSPNSIMA